MTIRNWRSNVSKMENKLKYSIGRKSQLNITESQKSVKNCKILAKLPKSQSMCLRIPEEMPQI